MSKPVGAGSAAWEGGRPGFTGGAAEQAAAKRPMLKTLIPIEFLMARSPWKRSRKPMRIPLPRQTVGGSQHGGSSALAGMAHTSAGAVGDLCGEGSSASPRPGLIGPRAISQSPRGLLRPARARTRRPARRSAHRASRGWSLHERWVNKFRRAFVDVAPRTPASSSGCVPRVRHAPRRASPE